MLQEFLLLACKPLNQVDDVVLQLRILGEIQRQQQHLTEGSLQNLIESADC